MINTKYHCIWSTWHI